ncbi:hypothetical protein D9M71_672680 [compost metagenome]
MVAHAHRRLPRALLIARLAGLALATRTAVAVGDLDAGLAQVGVPFTGRDLVAADGERLGEGHAVLRAFIGLAAGFVFRGAHGEAAGRQYEHFRAATFAVAKHLAGLLRLGGVCGSDAGHQGEQGQREAQG